ncbi:MAG: hypothetical protein UU16_C0035G0037 [Candidatus Woesebacteria bacterium GW2011_GWA2_40_7]|uniref:YokE-like PH domain-containing protein n=3 Tax=Candidatus Woeseibacteriota TaxID=1752722 RepID=A0A0G0TDP3_9BACT|nr:MAG: hypothetical protein UU16_C0035G0037 [Candidatus Woesebacteria bacterium GW2011_GWA2_40_7]
MKLMGLFGINHDKNERVLSFAFGGYKFKADDKYISYQSAYGRSFKVLKSDIETVSLDSGGAGKNKIKLNSKGTLLAEVELPKGWAEKVQDFILGEIKK